MFSPCNLSLALYSFLCITKFHRKPIDRHSNLVKMLVMLMALSWCDGFLAIRKHTKTKKQSSPNAPVRIGMVWYGAVLITHNIYLCSVMFGSFPWLQRLSLLRPLYRYLSMCFAFRSISYHIIAYHTVGTPRSGRTRSAGAKVHAVHKSFHFTQLHNIFHWSIRLSFRTDLKPTHNIWLL